MRKTLIVAVGFLACGATLSSKDKGTKVPFHDMAVGMRDAFNCGVVVEEYLHGSLKGNADEYHKQRTENACDHVEAVLNTLRDEDASQGKQ
jgi:hypothetical protein